MFEIDRGKKVAVEIVVVYGLTWCEILQIEVLIFQTNLDDRLGKRVYVVECIS